MREECFFVLWYVLRSVCSVSYLWTDVLVETSFSIWRVAKRDFNKRESSIKLTNFYWCSQDLHCLLCFWLVFMVKSYKFLSQDLCTISLLWLVANLTVLWASSRIRSNIRQAYFGLTHCFCPMFQMPRKLHIAAYGCGDGRTAIQWECKSYLFWSKDQPELLVFSWESAFNHRNFFSIACLPWYIQLSCLYFEKCHFVWLQQLPCE